MKVCEAPDCVMEFEPKRSTARFHSTTCRQRAGRARKAAVAAAAEEAKTDTSAEHPLVVAVRLELTEAKALMTVSGQIALQLARKMADPEASGLSALANQLRDVLAEAKGAIPTSGGSSAEPDPAAEDDEVKAARERREQKARAAAGRA